MNFKPPDNPWDVPELAQAELIAFRALAQGVANESQQKIALGAILYKFSVVNDQSFRPGGREGERATTFAEGKRFVGKRILEAISRPLKHDEGTNAAGRSDPHAATRRNPKPAGERSKPAKPEP